MNSKQKDAVEYFKKVDLQEISFSDARKALLDKGYSEEEITQAISDYADNKPKNTYVESAVTDEATLAIAKAKMTFVTERAIRDDQVHSSIISLFVPSRLVKGYYLSKFLKSNADAKDLEETGKIGPSNGHRPYERYRLIRHINWLNIISLAAAAIYIVPTLIYVVSALASNITSGKFDFNATVLYLVMLLSFIFALASPFVLFYAKKESTVRLYVIISCMTPGLVGLVFGILAQNIAFIILSLFAILYPLWQSNRVGLLSVMGRK